MSPPLFILSVILLFSTKGFAETLIEIKEGTGYTSIDDSHFKDCIIKTDGSAEFQFLKGEAPKVTTKFQVSVHHLNVLTRLIEESRTGKLLGQPDRTGGDAPSFTITAYPDSTDSKKIAINEFAMGRMYIDSPAGKRLARLTTRICGMTFDRMKNRIFNSANP